MGKNTGNELNAKRVISMEPPQTLPIPVFFGAWASFSTLIQMTSTTNLCKALLIFFPSKTAGNFSHSIILGEGEGRGPL